MFIPLYYPLGSRPRGLSPIEKTESPFKNSPVDVMLHLDDGHLAAISDTYLNSLEQIPNATTSCLSRLRAEGE